MCMKGPTSPSGKIVRGHLSNSESLAYSGLAGLICLLPACFSEVSCLLPVASQTAVFCMFCQRCSLFLISKTHDGVPQDPTTPLMSSLHQHFWAISLQELVWSQGMGPGQERQETQGSDF